MTSKQLLRNDLVCRVFVVVYLDDCVSAVEESPTILREVTQVNCLSSFAI